MAKSAIVVVLAIVLVGCGGPPDNPARRAQARQVAEAFVRAVSGGEADRGWSLLHPYSRDDWANQAPWVEAAADADWSRFAFTVLEARYCDDGVICPIDLEFPAGASSVPAFIRSSDAGIIFPRDDRADGDRAEIWIWLPDLLRGPGGIM